MDNEPNTTAMEEAAAPAATGTATATATAAPAAAKAPPAPLPNRLNEVVKQLKAELISGHERRRGSNPYDSQLGRPSRDVWGIRKRA
jgi:hypothetical protein